MKYSKVILSLVGISSVFAYNSSEDTPNDPALSVYKIQYNLLLENIGNNDINLCHEDARPGDFYGCFIDLDKNQESNCEIFYSEECQNFYKNPEKFLPNCGTHEKFLAHQKSSFELFCEKTKDGEYCPITKMFTDYGNQREYERDLLNSNCRYQNCNDAFSTYLNNLDSILNVYHMSEDIKAIKKRIDYINDGVCLELKKHPSTTINPTPTPSTSEDIVKPNPTSVQKTKNGKYCDVCIFEPNDAYVVPNPSGKDLEYFVKSDCFNLGASYCCDGLPDSSINQVSILSCSGTVVGGNPVPESKRPKAPTPAEKCSRDFEEYEECLFDYNYIKFPSVNHDQNCKNYKSEKCQNFIKDPKKYLPSCFIDSESDFAKNFDSKINIYNLICTKTNPKNPTTDYCPMSDFITYPDYQASREISYVYANCKYDSCYDAYAKVLDDELAAAKKSGDKNEIERVMRRINYIKDDRCLELNGKKKKVTTTTSSKPTPSSSNVIIKPHPTSIQKMKDGKFCDICVFEHYDAYTIPNPEGKDLEDIIKDMDCFMYGISYCCDGLPDKSINQMIVHSCNGKNLLLGNPVPENLRPEAPKKTENPDYQSLCENEASLFEECRFEFGNKSESEIISGCELFYSKKCQKFFEDPYRYAPSCFFSKDTPYLIENSGDFLYNFNSVCSRIINNKCTFSMNGSFNFSSRCEARDTPITITPKEIEYQPIAPKSSSTQFEKDNYECNAGLSKYDECFFNFFKLSNDEIVERCEVYESQKCQEFVNSPYAVVPQCDNAGQYDYIDVLNKIDTLKEIYDRVCSDNKKKSCKYEINYNIGEFSVNPILNDNYYYTTTCSPKEIKNTTKKTTTITTKKTTTKKTTTTKTTTTKKSKKVVKTVKKVVKKN